jgi:mono/diheme cytochrome c family protein
MMRIAQRSRAAVRRWFAGILVPGCLVVLAPAVHAESGGRGLQPSPGRELFVRYCVSCHGDQGRGGGPAAPALRAVPADLTTITARNDGEFPAAEMARYIDGRMPVVAHGTREMPVWGRDLAKGIPEDTTADEFARGKISALVVYLRTIQRGSQKREK